MWRVEDVLRELKEEGVLDNDVDTKIISNEDNPNGLPPGFRFHPTDEELITFYLASKVFNTTTSSSTLTTNFFFSNNSAAFHILEVDLTRCEPWDLPERAKMGEREWYLYSMRDRKYPSGLRTNRATETGYWKATGKDRQVYANGITTNPGGIGGGSGGVLIGMKKTLVFYQGRAPRGVKTKWVMHEYRLDGHFSSFRLSSKDEWVICRIFHKNGEKKSPPIIHPPPPTPTPPAPPLSPFLSSLPPLQEQTTTSATTQAVEDTPSHPPHYANHHLLHSLLLNPLPNFSSISGSDTIFPPLLTTTAAASVDIGWLHSKHKHLSSTTAATATATKQIQQQPQWLDKICPHQTEFQYFEHQYHNHLNIDQMNLPISYTTTTTTAAPSVDHDDDVNDIDINDAAAVHVDISPSLAVADALDRMLNRTPMAINHPAESWCFHIHP